MEKRNNPENKPNTWLKNRKGKLWPGKRAWS